MDPQIPRLTISFPQHPALPEVEIVDLLPFQVLLAAALAARVADKVMSQVEAPTPPSSPLVVAQRIPGGN